MTKFHCRAIEMALGDSALYAMPPLKVGSSRRARFMLNRKFGPFARRLIDARLLTFRAISMMMRGKSADNAVSYFGERYTLPAPVIPRLKLEPPSQPLR